MMGRTAEAVAVVWCDVVWCHLNDFKQDDDEDDDDDVSLMEHTLML